MPASPPIAVRPATAVWALVVLSLINILNYVDRFIVTALLPEIRAELSLTYREGGILGTAFIVVYALASPVFGWLGDRGPRKRLIALGVGLWSFATGLGGLTRHFVSLLLARATVGIGEAAYGTIAPAVIADHFPKRLRGTAMSIFFLAIPVGSAIGYLLGGVLGTHLGWRRAFFVVGFPGLVLALLVLFLNEPRRGQQDATASSLAKPRSVLAELFHNRLYLWTVLGYAAYTFAIGGLAYWTPSYMLEVRKYEQASGMLLFGGITVVTGILGTLAGGFLGDRLLRVTRKAYTWVGVVAVAGGAAASLAALQAQSNLMFLVWLATAELLLFLNTGPINALIVNAVRPEIRATAMALSVLTIHVLGDAISPFVIGALADVSNLATGMLAIPLFFVLASCLWAVTLQRRRA